MKLTSAWKADQPPTISFELFPAKSEKAAAALDETIDVLTDLKPNFVSVTFGAGGSTREGSLQLVQKLLQEKELEVLAYFACYGLSPADIKGTLDDYQATGVENVLAVRGDTPREEGFEPHSQSLPHASDLVQFIKPRYEFCLGVAGYPEGHIEAKSKQQDLEYLKLKIELGAEFIITNYFYDNRFYFDFVDRCRAIGINVPILPGVMPVYSLKMMEILANLCGATITDKLRQGIQELPENDKEALVDFGIRYALDQCRGLLSAGVPGIHFYTMDRSKSTRAVVGGLKQEGYL